MVEIDAMSLLKKEPMKIRFTSDEFGLVGLSRHAQIGDMVVCDRGIALELKEESKTRSVKSDFLHWFRFKARGLGDFAHKVELSEELITASALARPDMVLRSWEEIEAEHLHRHDFKRSKRPFIHVESAGEPCWSVLWEFYPSLGRIGVYIGRDAKGLGGYVCFYDRDQFKILT